LQFKVPGKEKEKENSETTLQTKYVEQSLKPSWNEVCNLIFVFEIFPPNKHKISSSFSCLLGMLLVTIFIFPKKFNFFLKIYYVESMPSSIRLRVIDFDEIGGDDLIGQCVVPISLAKQPREEVNEDVKHDVKQDVKQTCERREVKPVSNNFINSKQCAERCENKLCTCKEKRRCKED
jgi:hypothetical protein